jgi:hypothetical protein
MTSLGNHVSTYIEIALAQLCNFIYFDKSLALANVISRQPINPRYSYNSSYNDLTLTTRNAPVRYCVYCKYL